MALYILSSSFIVISVLAAATTALSPDGLSLLAFKSAVTSDPASSLSAWQDSDPDPCGWPGVACSPVPGYPTPRVVAISLPGKNLTGYIPSELGSLLFLRRLNLHGNRLSGPIPSQLFNASSLHSLFLHGNLLSGPLPPELCLLPRLRLLDLSLNLLSGPLPPELRDCRHLQRLLLSRNLFSGPLPAGIWPELLSLVQLDLSSNLLSGQIPSSLGNLPASVSLDLRFNNLSGEIPGSLSSQRPAAFLGNPSLCGPPLHRTCQHAGSTPPQQLPNHASQSGRKGLRSGLIVLISVADAAGVALIGLAIVYAYWKVKDREGGCSCTGTKNLGGDGEGGRRRRGCWPEREAEGSSEGEEGEGRLVAMDRGFKFELEELLRASAYLLGKGGRGIVYKVVLGNGVPVAVRRLGEGGGRRYREFAAEAQAVGRVRHPNLVRLRAYYWAPDEALLISDFVPNGNLASALKARPGQPGLPWPIRLKIAKGAARGLAHLHECSPRKFVHGDLKPSNIILDGEFNPCVSDFGLTRLINIAGNDPSTSSSSLGLIGLPSTKPAPVDRPNGYRAPEARAPGARPAQKWDVYSFGVVLLEMLTGKSPDTSSPATPTTSTSPVVEELVRWVRRGFEEAKPLTEIVDPALHKEAHAKKEVLAVFQVALACTEPDPEVRPRMKTVSDNLDRVGS